MARSGASGKPSAATASVLNVTARRRALSVHLAGSAFLQHRRSGISRYFAALLREFEEDPALGVDPVTPYRYLANQHVTSDHGRFLTLPVPQRYRRDVLTRLNAKRFRAHRPADVVHFPLYDPRDLDLAPETSRVTTVYDFTFEARPDLFEVDLSEHLRDKQRFLQTSDALLCISEATRRDLSLFHPELDKPTFVTPLAVSDGFFASGRVKPPRGVPTKYLLHVGNRAAQKNIDVLLRAFAVLAKEDTELMLVMSGAGVPAETERLSELGIAHRTCLLRVSDAHLPALYRHAAAFVFPSIYEGFGLPVIEAMAAGAPTVVSDIPALVEVSAGAAEVVAHDDVDGLIIALQRIMGDPKRAADLRARGARRARDFTWHRTAELTAMAYLAASAE